MHIFANDAVRLWRGPRDVAGHLRVVMRHAPGAKTERGRIDVTGLHRKARPVDSACIEPWRSARLQPAASQSELLQRFAQQNCVRLAGASRRILLLAAMNQPVEKCSGGDDDGLRADRAPVAKADAENARVLSSQFSVLSRL